MIILNVLKIAVEKMHIIIICTTIATVLCSCGQVGHPARKLSDPTFNNLIAEFEQISGVSVNAPILLGNNIGAAGLAHRSPYGHAFDWIEIDKDFWNSSEATLAQKRLVVFHELIHIELQFRGHLSKRDTDCQSIMYTHTPSPYCALYHNDDYEREIQEMGELYNNDINVGDFYEAR